MRATGVLRVFIFFPTSHPKDPEALIAFLEVPLVDIGVHPRFSHNFPTLLLHARPTSVSPY